MRLLLRLVMALDSQFEQALIGRHLWGNRGNALLHAHHR